jgi:hypothetical protein
MIEEIGRLRAENERLKSEVASSKSRDASPTFGGYTYDETVDLLSKEEIEIPITGRRGKNNLYNILLASSDTLAVGIHNLGEMSEFNKFVFFKVAPKLAPYGLVEKVKLARNAQRYQLSNKGHLFIAKAKPLLIESQELKRQNNQQKATPGASEKMDSPGEQQKKPRARRLKRESGGDS